MWMLRISGRRSNSNASKQGLVGRVFSATQKQDVHEPVQGARKDDRQVSGRQI